MALRLASPVPPSTEAIATNVIDSALEVHRQLGPGLLEAIYADAMTIELEHRGVRFEREREVLLYYRERPLRVQRLDLVVENVVVIELKAIERLAAVHQAQMLSYLRAANLRPGLLMNFNSAWLKGNIRRIILWVLVVLVFVSSCAWWLAFVPATTLPCLRGSFH